MAHPFLSRPASIFLWWWALATIGLALLQFTAWALADAAVQTAGSGLPWSILGLPVFGLLPAGAATRFFWPALMANATIWGLVLVVVVRKAWKRGPPRADARHGRPGQHQA